MDEYLNGLGVMEEQKEPVQMPNMQGFDQFEC